MPFETKPDFIQMERDILDLWDERRCFEKLREKNKDKKRFRFIDGPITANNPMGIHHAWGRSIKDIVLRYRAMNGCSCQYRNGFDTQGLWVEVEVEKELGFKDKKDVEAYGMADFTRKCVERIERYSGVITAQSKRLGQWMDWNNSYFTHTDENISAIWHFLGICHANGRIAKAHRPMPWCPRCGTSLSEHEMSGSHKDITHTAVFAVAKLPGAGFDVLVWTTTPWTLSANTALAVNPKLDYALVKCENFERPLVLAKNAIKHIDGEKQVIRLLPGSELTGLEYETFFPWLPAQKEAGIHKIIPWEDVGADEGSGVVHIAPGCGAQDYDLGKKFSLSEICPIDESGIFGENYDFLSGKTAAGAAEAIFGELQKQGKLFKIHSYTHSYPVCWRCKTEVLFRLVREWYIKTGDMKPKLLEAAGSVSWDPPFMGKRMADWLNNMGDWNISRKRFYGLPLPFYPCACGRLTVVGSKDELIALGGEAARNLPELHRPWIDEVKIKCPDCGAPVSRIPEVGDVWLDAGIVPFSTLGYFSDRREWEKNYPAQWEIEMQEQVRLWFYSQLFMSVTITGKAPYTKVQTHARVIQEDGSEFHKTGFMIRFEEAADKMGADVIRYLYAGAPMSSDVRFGFTLGEEARRKLLGFWNIYTFFMTYAEIDKPKIQKCGSDNLTDRWLENRVAAFAAKAKKGYENFNTPEIVREFEQCADDVSNWYVRINRRRFWKEGSDADKGGAYNALYFAIKQISQLMAPILPFMTEHIWQNMTLAYEKAEESIHLSDFPEVKEYDGLILDEVEKVRSIIARALKLRNEQNLKVRQPLSLLYLGKAFETVSVYDAVIRDELNIREIAYLDDFAVLSREYPALNFQTAGRQLKADLAKVKALCENLTEAEQERVVERLKNGLPVTLEGYGGDIAADCFNILSKDRENIAKADDGALVAINTEITPKLKDEGIYREVLRHCQLLRKEAGFAVVDRVTLCFETKSEPIGAVLGAYADEIAKETLSAIRDIPEPVMRKKIELDEGEITVSIG